MSSSRAKGLKYDKLAVSCGYGIETSQETRDSSCLLKTRLFGVENNTDLHTVAK